MRSKKILVIVARVVYFFFVFSSVNQPLYEDKGVDRSPHSSQYGVAYVYADSFDDFLKKGKDLGKGIVSGFTPGNIEQTLKSRGLGSQKSIVPYGEEASGEYGAYSSYASHPGTFQGMEPDPDDPIVKFLNDSYRQKEKYDLTHDPIFGQDCLQKGPDGKCLKWSSSRDLFTTSYQDCKKVEVPVYDGDYTEESCTETSEQNLTGYQCIDRAWTEVNEEVYTYPCNEINPGFLEGQIYVGCRDRYYWFKFKDRTETGRCSCVDTETENCLADTPSDFIEQPPPPGASFMGVTHENSAPAKKGRCTYDVYKWYTAYETSHVERVFIRYDASCSLGEDCSAATVSGCDPTGNNCMTLVDHGEVKGTLPNDSPAVKNTVSGIIGNYDVYLKTGTEGTANASHSPVVEFNNGTGKRELTQAPRRVDGSYFENGVNLTYFSVYGGPTVERPKSGWYTKFQDFSCESETGACQDLKDQGCFVASHECVDPDCRTIRYTYHCGGTGQILGYKTSYVCLSDLRCTGGECAGEAEEGNQDLLMAATSLEILNAYRTDVRKRGANPDNWRVFPGKAYSCQSSPQNCCKPTTGEVTILDYITAAKSVYQAYTTMSDGFNALVFSYEEGINYAVSQIFGTATSSTIEFVGGTGVETANVTLTTSGYEVVSTISGLSAQTIGTIVSVVATIAAVVGIIMVAYTLVMFTYNIMFGCKKGDQQTAARLGFKLCVNTGSKCKTKIFGICISREKLYCCFNSMLARIIQVQGRRQLLNKHHISYPWMLDDETPNCAGLRVKHFKMIDFSKIDLKEYMNYALKTYKKQVNTKMKQETLERMKQKFQ